MGDDHHGDAQTSVDVLNQAQDRAGGLGVQRAGGLVAQEHLRICRQGAGDGHPLFLSAGQLGRISVGPAGEVHNLQQLFGPVHGLLAGRFGNLHGETDVVQGCALHEQVEPLEDHADGFAGAAQLDAAEGGHVLAVHDDAAAGRTLQEVDTADQGAFPRAAQTDDAENLTRLDSNADILQGGDFLLACAEAFGHILQLNNWFCHSDSSLFLQVPRDTRKRRP